MLKLSVLILIFIAVKTFANNLNHYYQEGLAAAHANRHKPKEQVENYQPEAKFTNYNDQPPQISYYHGVKGYKTEELHTAGAAAAVYHEQDELNNAVQTAKKSLQRNPKEKIKAADPWLSKAGKIMRNAADLALGISSNNHEGVKQDVKAGINCEEAKACRIKLVKKTCNAAKAVHRICEKVPNITISDEIYHEDQVYSGSITPISNNSGTFTLPVSGTIISFKVVLKSRNIWSCNNTYPAYLQGIQISTYQPNCGSQLGDLNFSSSSVNAIVTAFTPVSFSFSGFAVGRWYYASYSLTIRANLVRKVAKVASWAEVNCHEE